MAELAGPEVIIEQITIEGDVITVVYALRSEQTDRFGRGHTIHVRADAIGTEAMELYEAAVAVVEAVEVLAANPPTEIRRSWPPAGVGSAHDEPGPERRRPDLDRPAGSP